MPTKKKKKSAAIDKKVRDNTAQIKRLIEMFGLLKYSIDKIHSQLGIFAKVTQEAFELHGEMHKSQGVFLHDMAKSLLNVDKELIKEVELIKRTHSPLPIERLSRRSDN